MKLEQLNHFAHPHPLPLAITMYVLQKKIDDRYKYI